MSTGGSWDYQRGQIRDKLRLIQGPPTVISAQCWEAFDMMVENMRYIFLSPLTESDSAALLLKKPGSAPSKILDGSQRQEME
ncbi:MAG: hypothetical protein LBD79_06255 [Treponema sp.]|jgi:hypothetical protein|nr:hypothetical protein [Treponema sp.]